MLLSMLIFGCCNKHNTEVDNHNDEKYKFVDTIQNVVEESYHVIGSSLFLTDIMDDPIRH
jgi:hypothetical protein